MNIIPWPLSYQSKMRIGKQILIAIAFLWLILFFGLSFLLILKISLSEPIMGIPPFKQMFSLIEGEFLQIQLYLGNYKELFQHPIYGIALWHSLKVATWTTLGCLLLGYPMAYGIAYAPKKWQPFLLLLVIIPFWTSFLLRVYAWMNLLSPQGYINQLLMGMGLIDEPVRMVNNFFGVMVGMIYCYLPFMVLPLYSAIEKLDPSYVEAARDLGASPFRVFVQVILPLTRKGILVGSMLVFVPSLGEFIIPALLGGHDTLMMGKVLWDEFFQNRDWPMAATLALILLGLILVPAFLLQRRVYEVAE